MWNQKSFDFPEALTYRSGHFQSGRRIFFSMWPRCCNYRKKLLFRAGGRGDICRGRGPYKGARTPRNNEEDKIVTQYWKWLLHLNWFKVTNIHSKISKFGQGRAPGPQVNLLIILKIFAGSLQPCPWVKNNHI